MGKIFLVILFVAVAAESFYDYIKEPENKYKIYTSIESNKTGAWFNLSKDKDKNEEITHIFFSLELIDTSVIHILMKDLNNSRWEVPELCNDYLLNYTKGDYKTSNINFTNNPFTLSVKGSQGTEPFISLFNERLRYFDKFIEFDVKLQTNRLFGLGERAAHFALPPGTYTIWNHGAPNPLDDGVIGGKNMYGSHPFYVSQLANQKQFTAVYFKNTNAQDAIIEESSDKKYTVTHRTIGGIIDLYIFYPNSIEHILKKYHTLIGKPYLPAFWSLGSQQSKWGYRSNWDIKRVINNYLYYEVPLDAITIDIDYMIDYELFTLDTKRYPNFIEFKKSMFTNNNLNLVTIQDPGVRARNGSFFYDKIIKNSAAIRSAKNPDYLIGSVWPGHCVFPDWMHPKGSKLWKEGLEVLQNATEFNGLMLDMMDIESFCDGECPIKLNTNSTPKNENCQVYDAKNHPPAEFDNLSYNPGNKSIETGTVSVSGFHCANTDYQDKFYKEYNLHNLFAFYEAKSTFEYYNETLKVRPFLLPRSTVPGSGHYASHWNGDNFATWSMMKLSISQLFSFQIFGIPHVGSDICGFTGDGDSELCARWYQVGVFYTMTRNHHIRSIKNQEPWVYLEYEKQPNLVLSTAKSSLKQKYALLRFFNTLMIESHLNGGVVVQPMYFEFPTDNSVFNQMEQSIMVGKAIVASLALSPNQKTIEQYFPNADWYELRSGKQIMQYNPNANAGKTFSLTASFDYINIHMRGGHIIPYQDTIEDYPKIVRSIDLLNNTFDLIIALNTDKNAEVKAEGKVAIDDGISQPPEFILYQVKFTEIPKGNSILFANINNGKKKDFPIDTIKKIKIFGISKTYSSVKANTKSGPKDLEFSIDSGVMQIEVGGISISDLVNISMI